MVVDGVLLLSLVLATLKLTFHTEQMMDVFLFDEATALRNGLAIPGQGLIKSGAGRLYAVWYWLVSQFTNDPMSVYFLNFKILVTATTAALYVALRRLGVVSFFASVIAFVYFVSFSPLVNARQGLLMHCHG